MSPSKPPATAATSFLGLGSNQGDRAGFLRAAVERLDGWPGTRVKAVSSLYATAPVGRLDQPEFLNAVAEVRTELAPAELLAACLQIEGELGRVRTERWGPRTIDLDLLLFGECEIAAPGLVVPHPRLRERAFVLQPLAEIAPDRRLGARTIAAWAAAVDAGGVRRLASPRIWPLKSGS